MTILSELVKITSDMVSQDTIVDVALFFTHATLMVMLYRIIRSEI